MKQNCRIIAFLALLTACGQSSDQVEIKLIPTLGNTTTSRGAPSALKSFAEKLISPTSLSLNSVSPTQTCVQTHLFAAYKPGADTDSSADDNTSIKTYPLRLRMPICTSSDCSPSGFNIFESLNLATVETPVTITVARNETFQVGIFGTLFPPIDTTQSPGDESSTTSGTDGVCDPKVVASSNNATLNYSVTGHREVTVTQNSNVPVNAWFVPSIGSYTLPSYVSPNWNPGSFNCPDRLNKLTCSVRDFMLAKTTVTSGNTIAIQSIKYLATSTNTNSIVQPLSKAYENKDFIVPNLFPIVVEVLASIPPGAPELSTHVITSSTQKLYPLNNTTDYVEFKDLTQ